jgi:hypothetical protein
VHGYALLPVAFRHEAAGDLEGAVATAAKAAEIGKRHGDPELMALAIHALRSRRCSSPVPGRDAERVARHIVNERPPQSTPARTRSDRQPHREGGTAAWPTLPLRSEKRNAEDLRGVDGPG